MKWSRLMVQTHLNRELVRLEMILSRFIDTLNKLNHNKIK